MLTKAGILVELLRHKTHLEPQLCHRLLVLVEVRGRRSTPKDVVAHLPHRRRVHEEVPAAEPVLCPWKMLPHHAHQPDMSVGHEDPILFWWHEKINRLSGTRTVDTEAMVPLTLEQGKCTTYRPSVIASKGNMPSRVKKKCQHMAAYGWNCSLSLLSLFFCICLNFHFQRLR